MRALLLQDGKLQLCNAYPRPIPGPGEALVQVLLAGICATDLELVKGYTGGFNGVLGHELLGRVVAAPAPEWIGKRVVSSINIGCGECEQCLGHGPEHCVRRRVPGIHGRDGVFAEYVSLPLTNLYQVPDTVSDEAAVFTEPLAAALRIREQVPLQPTARTAVVGPGRLGLLVGQVLALDGRALTMFGRRDASLQLPRRLGFDAQLIETAPDNHFDLVVEATGNPSGLAQALRLVRPLGTLVLKSTFAGAVEQDLTKLVVAEITVIGSRCGPFLPALRLLAEQRVQVQPLIEATFPLAEAVQAFAYAAQPGALKVLLRP